MNEKNKNWRCFEIKTSKGKKYLQYVFANKTIGEMLRVFPQQYSEDFGDVSSIIKSQDYYFVHFPLKATLKQEIVQFVDNFSIPSEVKLPDQMRARKVDKDGNFVSLQIVDYSTLQRTNIKELSSSDKKLSPWGTWNDTLLVERIEEGWKPEKW